MAIKKLTRRLLIALGVVVALIIVVMAVVAFKMDAIVRVAVEKTMSHVLQVDVTLGGADVSIFGGSVALKDLRVGNPDGFKTPSAFECDKARVRVDIKSFRTDQPVIELISIDQPKVTLEQGLKQSNIGKLIDNASRFDSGGGEKPDEEEAASQKKIRIDKVTVQKAGVALSAPVLKGRDVGFTLPTLTMNNIGGEKQNVSIARSLQIFFAKLLTEAIQAGGDVIPGDLRKDLQQSLAQAQRQIDRAKEELEKRGNVLKKKIEDEGGLLGGKLKDATEGLGDKLDLGDNKLLNKLKDSE